MSQIIFPPDPEIGQEYTEGEKVGRWNGFRWRAIPSSLIAIQNQKADLDSPEFIGVPIAPTAAAQTDTTQIATTAFVQGELSSLALGDTNIIEEIQAEGTPLNITGKAVNVTRAALGAAEVEILTVNISLFDTWSEETGYYTLELTVNGLLDTDNPIVDVDYSYIWGFSPQLREDAVKDIKQYGLKVVRAVATENKLTLFALDEPTFPEELDDFRLQIKVVR